MAVRRLDENHDWTFGGGKSNYARESEAIAQNVQCRVWSFSNDWFLDPEHGIPWFDLMGRNIRLDLIESEIKKTVLETKGVVQITYFNIDFNREARRLTVNITYIDTYKKTNSINYVRGPND